MTDAVLSNLIAAASGIVGAVIGGSLAVWGAIKAVEKTSQDLESTEIRRQKIVCIVAIHGLRWVIGDGVKAQDEYKSRFMYEMNKIPSLWADDAEVMKNLRDFHAERNNERFIALLRHLGSNTKLSTGQLSDADFRTVSQLPLTGL
ncbi:MAG: hypothetical protein M3N41_07795 [Acidobacteriota bacterium]|nr:hypothetical protein [Acidobacteriota bacterium]MDP9112968.1 hypothetical protein [Acidobacteriota bacterium]